MEDPSLTRRRRRVRLLLNAVTLVFFLGWAYESVYGFPFFFEGQVVFTHTRWYQAESTRRRTRLDVYHFYRGGFLQRVRHGHYTEYHGNGRIHTTGIFRHGAADGRWLEYDSEGTLTTETIWRNGLAVGWGNYAEGRVGFYREDLYVDDEVVATKQFERGRWALIVYPGCPRLFMIDPITGKLSPLPGQDSKPRCSP